MERITLNVETRTKTGKGISHSLRRQGKIPAVLYGKGIDNLKLSVALLELEKALSTQAGMNAVLQLNVEGKGAFDVLMKDYQADAVKRKFTHADFLKVDLSKKITVAVPVHLTGKPEGLKEGGILEQVTRELKVLCFPLNIPGQIEVDVSALKIGQNLHLKDVTLPSGVESAEADDVTIALVSLPKEEEVLTPGVMTEPEVLTAKKEEGEEGAAPAEGKAAAPAEVKGAAPAGKQGGEGKGAAPPAKAPAKEGEKKK
ncbi:MAG: 50S ribosomal protein L25 [Deltaproteobacteria bacterium]|nr:50S ribosomal protein L25 [Deltaproteobacteria bacterium]